MNEDTKKEIAVFRFGVIADLVEGRKLLRGEKERILKEKTSSQGDPYVFSKFVSIIEYSAL